MQVAEAILESKGKHTSPMLALKGSAQSSQTLNLSAGEEVVAALDAPAAVVFEAYANIFNRVAVRRMGGASIYTDRCRESSSRAASRHVSCIRAQLDADAAATGSRGFDAQDWRLLVDYLFTLKASDVLGSSGAQRDHVAGVKATLRDGSGFVEGNVRAYRCGLTAALVDTKISLMLEFTFGYV